MATAAVNKIPPITRISSKLIRILGCNPGPMTLQGTNIYLLGNGQRRLLIDTGDANIPECMQNLKAVLIEEKATISNIILTHWHHDHIGGLRDVLQTLTPLNGNDCHVWKYPRTDAADNYDSIPSNVKLDFLTDGQEFSVDGANVKIVHTPGHTTDHVVVVSKEDGALFSGDCILGEGTAIFEDLYDYMRSLELIIKQRPVVIYPAHGNIIQDPLGKIQYYIDHRKQREIQILDTLQSHANEQLSDMDIVKLVYAETPQHLWLAAARNVNQHLEKLLKERRIKQLNENEQILWQFNADYK